MYRVELYAQVRRSVFVEGLSEREAAKRFGLARGTVRKMLRYATPPGYRRRQPAQRPKLDPFTGIVDQILIDDQERPKKQRHTAKRIFDRLRDEYDFTGGYTIVKDYVRDKKLGGQEMFVPLVHPPGDAQADFGEALVVIDGVQRKAHYLVVDLPHSDDAFVKAFPAETTEAFCEGHNAAQAPDLPERQAQIYVFILRSFRASGQRTTLNKEVNLQEPKGKAEPVPPHVHPADVSKHRVDVMDERSDHDWNARPTVPPRWRAGSCPNSSRA